MAIYMCKDLRLLQQRYNYSIFDAANTVNDVATPSSIVSERFDAASFVFLTFLLQHHCPPCDAQAPKRKVLSFRGALVIPLTVSQSLHARDSCGQKE